MRLLTRSARQAPTVSVVLLDWSVRESFHLLHYLSRQTLDRDRFEVLVIEYYSRRSPALDPFVDQVDTWALLEMPAGCYYHKHLMYNAGIALARGEVLVFCDSDAMVRPTFVQTIADAFATQPDIVLHLDQFRNLRRDFYPFSYPSFEDVLGPGCINNAGGQTTGVARADDPIHERNYGACMCARRDDLIAIGGADEHLDYLGHICGPYDMTFRLVNLGRREVWHPSEFLFHTWHPGQAGVDNYLGPHDGRHMSTTALEALVTRRTEPYVINPGVSALRDRQGLGPEAVEALVIAPDRARQWTLPERPNGILAEQATATRGLFDYRGFRVRQEGSQRIARLIVEESLAAGAPSLVLSAASADGIRRQIDRAIAGVPRLAALGGSAYVLILRTLMATRRVLTGAVMRATRLPGRIGAATVRALRRTVDRVRRFFLERSHLSGALTSLIVNLYFVQRRAQLARDRPLVLVVDSRATAYYVRGLRAIGVLPRLRIVHVRGDDMAGWLIDFSRTAGDALLFIGREVYIRHYASFAEAGLVTRTTVL